MFGLDAGVLLDKTRTKLGLLLQADQTQIKMLLQTYPWPKYMGSVNTLVLIKELTDLDKSALKHDRCLGGIQDRVTGSLNTFSSCCQSLRRKRRKFSRQQVFDMVSHMTR